MTKAESVSIPDWKRRQALVFPEPRVISRSLGNREMLRRARKAQHQAKYTRQRRAKRR